MRVIGNFIWFIFGGIFMGLFWWLIGALAYLSIIGIPWGKACFVIGQFSFLPFGKETIRRNELTGTRDIGTGAIGLIGNIVWLLLAGIWLALGHVIAAILNFITIIGIPLGIQHLKLASVSLAPIGQTVVSKEMGAATRSENARQDIADLRN
jgi:uncharacterized membrane protein YccF (DUF307 family)